MFAAHNLAVLELLRADPTLAAAALDELWAAQGAQGRSVAALAIENKLIDRRSLLARVAQATGCEFLAEIPPPVTEILPEAMTRRLGVLAVQADERSVDIAVEDPFTPGLVEELAFVCGREVRVFVVDPDELRARIDQQDRQPDGSDRSDSEPITGRSDDQVVGYVDEVIARAVRDRASDIHFEPFEREFVLRYRIDGVLHELPPPPRELAAAIASRIKVLANLNIAERRIAQDGRITTTIAGRTIDLRVSTLPTQFGESVVLRILDQKAVQLDLAELGMPALMLQGVRDVLRRPNGIFIVTGPTGSGKTTTLYSGLRFINTADAKLLTVEDPVEYELDGVMQVPINPVAGLTFASALRSFLRQDPDIVMVGEIRDLETAQIAIQAALTGHLVLTTLHTNDAVGTITRLIDMGVEPFLLASTLEAVLAQRLVRRVCETCRTAYQPEPDFVAQLGNAAPPSFQHGVGCPDCLHTGYRGRVGIFEFLSVTDDLRQLITNRAPIQQVRAAALRRGLQPIRDAGVAAIAAGQTTVEEVLKFV